MMILKNLPVNIGDDPHHNAANGPAGQRNIQFGPVMYLRVAQKIMDQHSSQSLYSYWGLAREREDLPSAFPWISACIPGIVFNSQ